jgi:LPS export ABC transporter protein LptC
MSIHQSIAKEIPIFEFRDFTMYELDNHSLQMQMKGSQASKYQDRYEIDNINYLDNTQQNRANMVAQHGTYKDDVILLDGDVFYKSLNKTKFTFHTKKARYEKRKSLIISDSNYTITFDHGSMRGVFLQYNTKNKTLYSKDVTANYTIY